MMKKVCAIICMLIIFIVSGCNEMKMPFFIFKESVKGCIQEVNILHNNQSETVDMQSEKGSILIKEIEDLLSKKINAAIADSDDVMLHDDEKFYTGSDTYIEVIFSDNKKVIYDDDLDKTGENSIFENVFSVLIEVSGEEIVLRCYDEKTGKFDVNLIYKKNDSIEKMLQYL